MPALNLPYQPIRQSLYTARELFEGYDSADKASWASTTDFAIYKHFVVEGRNSSPNPYIGMMQALHDNAITQATTGLIAGKKVAAIMGGHKMLRDSAAYKDTAILARRLTRNGILVCTGGGPGAMEAGHLGSALANSADPDLDEALKLLKKQPAVPALGTIVAANGQADPALVEMAHDWFKPAKELAASIRNPGNSLAIPTWHYGHEPTTPFATHIAKYFQNSIREDGLLALAGQGVIYTEGKAGTIQEIFQDAAQNYYKSFGHFSPMVLLGVQYWTMNFPVTAVLQKLFPSADFEKYVLVTDDVNAAAKLLEEFVP